MSIKRETAVLPEYRSTSDRRARPFPGGSELSPDLTREAVRSLLDALRNEETERVAEALKLMFYTCAWREAFLAIRREANPSDQFRSDMRGVWARRVGVIRNGVGDDLLLADCLRKLLKPYDGDDMVLYRGETFNNRCTRTYGFCWSSSEACARLYAENSKRCSSRGSVLLRALVPKEAIISHVGAVSKFPREEEYVVDRRLVSASAVKVVERYTNLKVATHDD